MPTVFDSSPATESVTLRFNVLLVSVSEDAVASESALVSKHRIVREIVLPNTVYVARIRAFNKAGLFSDWSGTVSTNG